MLAQYNELQAQTMEENMEMQKAQAFWNPLESMTSRDATSKRAVKERQSDAAEAQMEALKRMLQQISAASQALSQALQALQAGSSSIISNINGKRAVEERQSDAAELQQLALQQAIQQLQAQYQALSAVAQQLQQQSSNILSNINSKRDAASQ
jgi:hypothetical protein